MTITSTAFQNNSFIQNKYTCDGENINPPLSFSKVPAEAQSLVLVVEDPDAPSKIFTHWLIYNMPPATLQILENQVPPNSVLGMTDFGKAEYGGPCPPPPSNAASSGKHRYFFKLFALDKMLDIQEGASKEDVEKAMEGHILGKAEIVGLYRRK